MIFSFDTKFHVQYRSEEISPVAQLLLQVEAYPRPIDVLVQQGQRGMWVCSDMCETSEPSGSGNLKGHLVPHVHLKRC